MKILVEAPLPSTCYLDEAVFWIMFGCVPHHHVGTEHPEFRLSLDAALEDGPHLLPLDEVGALRVKGVEVDEERFYGAYDETEAEYVEWRGRLRASVEQVADLGDQHGDGRPSSVLLPEFDDETAKAIDDLRWAKQMRTRLESDIDLGRARLFQELALGSLQAYGYPFSDDGASDAASHHTIDKSFWKLSRVDWRESVLTSDGTTHVRGLPVHRYGNVQVHFGELLKIFPHPSIQPQPTHGVVQYGACYLIEDGAPVQTRAVSDGSAAVVRRSKRGRPPKGSLSAREVALNYFADRIDARQSGDSDALVADIVDFVQKSCNETVGRSTVHDWFAFHRRAMPEKMPVIHAGK